jgi:hypothetical protein
MIRFTIGFVLAGLVGCAPPSSQGASDAGSDAGCKGDPEEWAAILSEPLTCTRNSDCCVAVNECLEQAIVVTAPNVDRAQTAWYSCFPGCNGCVRPSVSASCVNGQCVGHPDDGGSRCGVDEPAARALEPDGGTPDDAGKPQRLFGCGLQSTLSN